jgi:hypothetical protein
MQKAALKTNDASNTDLEVLLDLNRNYVRSALESDVHWYAENLSEDFYITVPDGALLDRKGFLKRIANPYPGRHAEPVDVMVRILDDVATYIPVTGIRSSTVNRPMDVTRTFTSGGTAGGFASLRISCAFRPRQKRNTSAGS